MGIDCMDRNGDISLPLIFYLIIYFISILKRDAYLSILICQFITLHKLQNMEWYITGLTEVAIAASGGGIVKDLKSLLRQEAKGHV